MSENHELELRLFCELEGRDFTRWLAGNNEELGSAFGVELEEPEWKNRSKIFDKV